VGNYIIVPSVVEHALSLAPYMRADDMREIYRMRKSEPLSALVKAVNISDKSWTAFDRDWETTDGTII